MSVPSMRVCSFRWLWGLLWFLECVGCDPQSRLRSFGLSVSWGVADDLASQGAELRHKIYHLGV
nr:MAG TPA: hypothetical protein [Caudoviricetes sp.]